MYLMASGKQLSGWHTDLNFNFSINDEIALEHEAG